jgi:UDP-N-acetylglucosamine diphosphorylase/glucosamine-1-phosphate N-acetyltransferase
MQTNSLAIIILAAGKGKRMNNPDLPKVLAKLNQKPLLQYVLELSRELNANPIISIIGHHKDQVISFLDSYSQAISDNSIQFAIQEEQLGTGHAVQQTESLLKDFHGNVLILSGDVPLLTVKTISEFSNQHNNSDADLSVLSSTAPNPFGYGRIVRNSDGSFQRIVEEKDADENLKKIDEINSGIYLVESKLLFSSLHKVKNTNAQAEFYLTDIIEICRNEGKNVKAFNIGGFQEIQGINSQQDLENVAKLIG